MQRIMGREGRGSNKGGEGGFRVDEKWNLSQDSVGQDEHYTLFQFFFFIENLFSFFHVCFSPRIPIKFAVRHANKKTSLF